LRAAVSFLTAFGGARQPGPTTLDWFPAVGACLGLALGGAWWVATRAWGYPVAAVIVVIADLGVTGMLHFDGLVDIADGLLPPLESRRRLEVMADPRVGAFGVAAGGAVLLLRWAALASLRPGILLLAGLWCLSRTAMAVVVRTQPYVRGESGLARPFGTSATGGRSELRRLLPLAVGVVLASALLAGWRVGPGLAAGGAAVLTAAAVVVFARRRIGGYTGDVLGASGILAESVGLMVAAAKW
jgi:adenosylcobinamide-GDP ribazoletransferase